jgi:hypothetical protein
MHAFTRDDDDVYYLYEVEEVWLPGIKDIVLTYRGMEAKEQYDA